MSKSKVIELDERNTCKLCENALAKYSCPKCDMVYCSVACYQSEKHSECSEEFYKNCVVEELNMAGTSDESKRKMLEMLQRNRIGSDNDSDEGPLDSDDDPDMDDLGERLAGIDLDNADDVWEHMTADEQKEFIAFLKSEDVAKLIPPWTPWWSHKCQKVEELETVEDYKKECPQLVTIKSFSDLSRKEPADCVKFNLINVLASYAFATRYFNGEHSDFTKECVTCIMTISLSLKSNENFDDFESAVKSVEHECTETDWILAGVENFSMLREDLERILEGPDASEKKFYALSALSDLSALMNSAAKRKNTGDNKAEEQGKSAFGKTFLNDHFPNVQLKSKSAVRKCVRKIDYFLAYTKDFFEYV